MPRSAAAGSAIALFRLSTRIAPAAGDRAASWRHRAELRELCLAVATAAPASISTPPFSAMPG